MYIFFLEGEGGGFENSWALDFSRTVYLSVVLHNSKNDFWSLIFSDKWASR